MATVINESQFSELVLESQVPVLVDFYAPWCGPCKMLAPILDQLTEELGESARIYKIDVDQDSELAAQFGVMNVPTLILFKEGKEVERIVGAKPKGALRALFN